MKTYKRPLNKRQASACEKAKRRRCVCRCGGVLHGGSHYEYMREEEKAWTARFFPISTLEVESMIRQVAGLPGLEAQVRP